MSADPDTNAAVAAEQQEDEHETARAKAEEEGRAKEAMLASSFSRTVLQEGTGKLAWRHARALVHVVGTLQESGERFEDSVARGEPFLLLLGRGDFVPGLERALLQMRAGERASITVQPEGGYGASGNAQFPRVPGSATLVYEVELLSLEEEGELWTLSFEQKMSLARERHARAKRLFGRNHFSEADSEYEQAMRYLVFMTHPTAEEQQQLDKELLTTQLNLAATKLRCGCEKAAIAHALKALQLSEEHPKALYRLGQAYTQLGEYDSAREHLRRAAAAPAADKGVAIAVRKELERLEARKERHQRQRQRTYQKMLGGEEVEPDQEPAQEPEVEARPDVAVAETKRPVGLQPLTIALLAASATAALIATIIGARALSDLKPS